MMKRSTPSRAWALRVVASFARSLAGVALALVATGGPTTALAADLRPPEVVHRVDAAYPKSALDGGLEGRVTVVVSVGVDGAVLGATVAESAGADLDAAALEAVKLWRFRPATRDGQPIPSRIRVPFRFVRPVAKAPAKVPVKEPTKEPAKAPVKAPAKVPAKEPALRATKEPGKTSRGGGEGEGEGDDDDERIIEVSVSGHRKVAPVAVSDFVLDKEIFAIAPVASAGDLLSRAPGVYVSRPEGDAIAHEIYLRGFNAEHGQDIELSVGGIPINQMSHIHGQGYADLNFLIPEVVRAVRVTEGVYDPRQGDFAVAGSIAFDLGVTERGYLAKTSFGSWGTWRQLALWAPRGEADETFAAAAIRQSNGFGQNRASLSGGGIAQSAFEVAGFRGLAHVAAFGARANIAGVLRYDDVNDHLVNYYGSYPVATAQNQSALSSRVQAGLSFEKPTYDGGRTELAFWWLWANYRSRTNFTGFLERSQINPDFVGRGDLIEQANRDLGFGTRVSHRTPRLRPADWAAGNFELGFTHRTHFIDQAQNLLQAPQNETWDKRVDAAVQSSDFGLYLDADWRFLKSLRLRGGVRADVLYFDVDDRLGNFIPVFQRQSYIVGFRRTALGASFGPRTSLEYAVNDALTLQLSYGQGYRSPQALQLSEGENAPFAKVHAAEVGGRWKSTDERLSVVFALFLTKLSLDVAFDPTEGSLQKVGPTTRLGLMAQATAKPWPWLFANLSFTYVHATVDEPPPATAAEPNPPFTPGQLLPYVPPFVMRLDVGVDREIARLEGSAVGARFGLGLSFVSARPLPYSRSADPFALADATLAFRWRFVEIGLEATNIFNTHYAATEYSFVSSWGNREFPSNVPARHFAAGAPATVMSFLALRL